MFKFLRSLAIWHIIRTNRPIFKKCVAAVLIFLFSFYFFPDWEAYFEKKDNLDLLLYTKFFKYLFLVSSAIWFYSNVKKLTLISSKAKKSDESLSEEEDVDTKKIADNELEELRDIDLKPKLRSKSERIAEKYEKDLD